MKNTGDGQAVERLIAALRDGDSDVRGQAAEELRQHGDLRAVEPLIAALADEEPYVRIQAAETLTCIGA
ncbi:MAG: HEAT repeat domain-containing protein, partial [Anaerolineae bacterium]